MTKDSLFLEAIQLLEQAKEKIELMRAMSVNDAVAAGIDGRSLSIAVTHLETSQLWVANARQ